MSGRKLSAPVTGEQAVEEMRAGGYEPQEPYPGRATAPWRSKCMKCGQVRSPRLTAVRNGRRCTHSSPREPSEEQVRAELAEAGFDLVAGYDGKAITVLTLRCRECGGLKRFHLGDVRSGRRCAHKTVRWGPVSAEEAVEEMREYGWEPQEPYPGESRRAWRQRCMKPGCGRVRSMSLARARRGSVCTHGRER